MNVMKRAAATRGAILFGAMASMGLALSMGTSQAQLVSPKAGQEVAEKLCTSCHIVGKEPVNASMPSDVPSFTEIANLPDQTEVRVAGRIVVPHPAMPQIHLTREEIANLAAYIMSLRSS